jgi:D-serine deaminase-like pyridoxal phosphate-dependent protein
MKQPSTRTTSISQNSTPFQSPHDQHDYAYYQHIFRGRALPLAYLDLDLLDQNIRLIASRAGGKRIRLASKSIRCPAVLQRILAADPCFQGIMGFTAREAVYLSSQGFDDILLGYPIYQTQDIAAVAQATRTGAHITLMVDSLAHVQRIEQIAQQHGVNLPLCLDIDMSLTLPGLHFGVWRSPLQTPEQTRALIEHIIASPDVHLAGLMGYEAQIAGIGDNVPGAWIKNHVIRLLKHISIREVTERRAAIVELVKTCGGTLRFVNGGGTGSLATTREEPTVTEITVGSGFYSPALFDLYQDFRYQPAAGFAIEIVRIPGPGRYTCLGGGYIASGAVGPEKLPKPYLPPGTTLEPLEGAGEVQTPIRYSGSIPLKQGDPIFLRHSKAGELCERFTHLHLIADGAIVAEVPTYRGAGQCFI